MRRPRRSRKASSAAELRIDAAAGFAQRLRGKISYVEAGFRCLWAPLRANGARG